MSSESVKVAVRLRPFNQREKERNAELIINMSGKQTKIANPKDPANVKVFNFDYSYWSHDGFKSDSNNVYVPDGPTSIYASQQKVFMDLGQGVLDNAIKGYNCSLFAYGQTGSGKSYSMIGFDNNKGIVPITCSELFKIIDANSNESMKYGVQLSMLEIYNERIRDLLVPSSESKGNLAIRESKNLGFFVQDLKKVPVGNYEQIEKRMKQGTSNRTIAATQMNATSSRAHTVITIEFNQLIKSGGTLSAKSSVIQLIDLAGSERADSTGATGDRLKEGASINKSLSALGNVIAALADSTSGNSAVPYRDSVLTKLLKNALGGNSKTVMIAALSPADINYEETLSTLRYADRVKKIKNVAIVNENPLEKLIRELREENERLKMALNGQLPKDINTQGMTKEDIINLRKEIEEELKLEIDFKSSIINFQNSEEWQAKIRDAETQNQDETVNKNSKFKAFPSLTNINEDPQLSGALCYFIETSTTLIGKLTNSSDNSVKSIKIFGLGIKESHAVINYDSVKHVVSIKPTSSEAIMKVNGQNIGNDKEIILSDNDRLVFGSTTLFLFNNPHAKNKSNVVWDWESAQKEIAAAEGLDVKDVSILESQIIEILPMVIEVNTISKEMGKNKKFDVLIIPEEAQPVSFREEAKPKVMVKMTSLINNNTWMMERSHFINRRYIIQEMYEKFLDGENINKIQPKEDPFWEPTSDILVGIAPVFLQNLLHGMGMEHSINVVDYKGRVEGILALNIEPCYEDGVTLDSKDHLIEDPSELLMKPYFVKISINHLTLIKTRFIHGSNVKFSIYNIDKEFETKTCKDSLESDFHFTKIINWPKITKDHLEYFKDGTMYFCVYGIQKDIKEKTINNNLSYKQSKLQIATLYDVNRMNTEKTVSQTLRNRQYRKTERIKQLCMDWANKPMEEQIFDDFFKSVSAIAFSTENKFKTTAKAIGKTIILNKFVVKKHIQTNNQDSERLSVPKQRNQRNNRDCEPSNIRTKEIDYATYSSAACAVM